MDSAQADQILNYWQAIEYLQPAVAPRDDPSNLCWTVRAEKELPWIDERKRRRVVPQRRDKFRWEFIVYAGLVDMKHLGKRLSELLGVEEPDRERDRPTEPAAVLGLQVDAQGVISCQPGLSSLPWAVSRIKQAVGDKIDFNGYSGEDGFERATLQQIKNLLVERQVPPEQVQQSPSGQAPNDIIDAENAESNPEPAETRQLERLPTTWEDIGAAVTLALQATGCTEEFVLHDHVRVQAIRVSLKRDDDEPESQAILNSSLVQDLAAVRRAWSSDDVGAGLRAYMAGGDPGQRIDVIHDDDGRAVVARTMPRHLPAGRWPAHYPMVLAQQFAVNIIGDELLGTTGLFSVNGPPGTGKTTMLRDVVALLVVERAKALAALESPTTGFARKSQPIRGDRPGTMYPVHEQLHGFGMVVACLSNGAAQNVTRELPAAKSIDAQDVELDYFSAVAETLLAGPKDKKRRPGSAWGLIAAVLGRSELRNHFVNRFWFVNGGEPYKQAQPAEPDDEFVSFRTVLERGVPGARPWIEQRKTFKVALERADTAMRLRQQLAEAVASYGKLMQRADAAQAVHDQDLQVQRSRQTEQEHARATEVTAQEQLEAVSYAAKRAKALARAIELCSRHAGTLPEGAGAAPTTGWCAEHVGRRLAGLKATAAIHGRAVDDIDRREPGAFARFFNTRGFRAWSTERANAVVTRVATDLLLVRFASWADEWLALELRLTEAQAALDVQADAFSMQAYVDALAAAQGQLATCKAHHGETRTAARAADQEAAISERQFSAAQRELAAARDVIGQSDIDALTLARWNLPSLPERERQKIAPWSDATLEKLRNEVFVEAIELHKSFIASNAQTLKANLGHLVDLVQGKLAPSSVAAGVEHLWESLFLCVPVVSTTFASMANVFKGMGRESLGWVFIDEAGQAPPQAAAGAIWRAKRTLAVGDPLQLKPVVTIPARVVDALEDRFALPPKWNPRATSAQVLADRANRYGTVIDDEWIGSPLRVHRRCIEPMFKVANAISYDGLMEYDTRVGQDEVDRGWLGQSCWIDVPSRAGGGHWIPEQGQVALDLLQRVLALRHVGGKLFNEDGRANVYLIAPFSDVAERARRAVVDDLGLRRGLDACGTIHTFQGKEADVVILLLGGDLARPGAISGFAAAEPNLLNVALTRAKRRVYVVGQHDQWSRHRYFDRLARELKVVNPQNVLSD
jgi:hypothetical protein